MGRFWRLGSFCVLVLVFGVTAARSVSRKLLFPIHEVGHCDTPNGFVRHVLTAADGVTVHALELPAPAHARTLVYFHNNRETAESRASLARALRARGVGVMLVEYRGYGASEGEPSEGGLYLDAEAALDLLARRGTGADRIVLWGTSLGTGVAAEMARRGRGSRLVMEAPYTSIPDVVRSVAPIVPSILIADRFDTLAKADEIRVPTLIIHGDADEIVPFSMGEQLARTLRDARLLCVRSGHHGDLFARERERLLDTIASFAG